jgi:antitoxin MazE
MRSEIVKIGNSQGLRLPKVLLEQCGFEKTVEIRVEGNCLIIQPVTKNRSGWEEAFSRMVSVGDDEALIDDSLGNAFDKEEWAW